MVLVFSFEGCKQELPELTFSKEPYLGTQIRVDGLYYSTRKESEDQRYIFYFFNRNGVFRIANSSLDSTAYQNDDWTVGDARFRWGLFKINENEIIYEMWTPDDTWIFSGLVLNDTTFHIDLLQNANGSDVRMFDETYHFVEYSPKPDSISQYVP